jgi:RHS repeat-associated protein
LATTWTHGVYAKEAYAPFGETYNEAGTPDRSFTGAPNDRSSSLGWLTGQDQDTVPGVYDYLFRKYDPAAGRWLSPDPSGWKAVSQSYPQSLNRYAYVQNNPMSQVDADGLIACYLSDGSISDIGNSTQDCVDAGGSPYWGPSETVNVTADDSCDMSSEACQESYQELLAQLDRNKLYNVDLGSLSSGGSGAASNGLFSELMNFYCSAVPSGRSISLSGALGGIGSVTGGVDQVLNYNSGQTSVFATGGMSFGWNGGASATATTGLVYGLDGTNNGFSGPFKGASFYAPTPVPFVGVGGSVISGGGVTVVSAGASAALAGKYGGGISATNTSKPLNTGIFNGFSLGDYFGYLARRPCN